jgi:hypothetical protein
VSRPGLSLDDGRGRLGMAPATGEGGQHWCLVPHGAGKHALRSLRLGDCWSLDVDHDRRAVLAPTQDVTGQLWTVIPRADGTVELRPTGHRGPGCFCPGMISAPSMSASPASGATR